jgi:hypothetical protein
MNTPATNSRARVEREVERERDERLKNDDARSGIVSDDDLRSKDARNSSSSGHLNRQQGR